MFKLLALGAVFISLVGCQTGVFIRESPAAMTDIRKAFVVIFGEPRSTSYNGQELISKFHDKRNRIEEGLDKAKTRYFTKLTILGDRRPFQIKVEVFQEVKISGQQYEVIDEDIDMARKTAQKLEDVLNQSLKNRNVIDDFRAF